MKPTRNGSLGYCDLSQDMAKVKTAEMLSLVSIRHKGATRLAPQLLWVVATPWLLVQASRGIAPVWPYRQHLRGVMTVMPALRRLRPLLAFVMDAQAVRTDYNAHGATWIGTHRDLHVLHAHLQKATA